MEKLTQKIAKTRINTRFLGPTGGGGVGSCTNFTNPLNNQFFTFQNGTSGTNENKKEKIRNNNFNFNLDFKFAKTTCLNIVIDEKSTHLDNYKILQINKLAPLVFCCFNKGGIYV